MRLAFANNFYYVRGGSETVLFGEMELLRSRGHEVAPFTRQFKDNNFSEYSRYFPSPLEYDDVTFPKKIRAAFEMIYSKEAGTKFYEFLRAFKPDLVHAHNIYGRLTTSIIDAARKNNRQVVMSLHDYKLICPSYLMLSGPSVCEGCRGRRFYHCLLSRCHRGKFFPSLVYTAESYFSHITKKYDHVSYFICPSRFLLEKHAGSGIPRDKLVHIPHFVEVGRTKPNFAPGEYILFSGRLSREKGLGTLLKAVKGLDCRLLIAGEGPMRREYESFVREGSMKNVVFIGYKEGEELKSLYMNSAFLVFPSEWYEVVGMSILEAFACGKPVVGSNIGAIPETVVDGETGLLFNVGDENELRAKIEMLAGSPSLIEKMGRRARTKVEEEFNAERHYEQLMEIYKKAIG